MTAKEVLGEYHGNVVADGYEPYQIVARAGPDGVPRYTLAFCWAHVRRKYVKAEPFAPACAEVIDLIGKLYEVERDLPNPHALTGVEREAALARILAVRREISAPVVDEIKKWAERQQGLPESTFRKAIKYMLDLWQGLTVFLGNPWVPLDNNFGIRPEERVGDQSRIRRGSGMAAAEVVAALGAASATRAGRAGLRSAGRARPGGRCWQPGPAVPRPAPRSGSS